MPGCKLTLVTIEPAQNNAGLFIEIDTGKPVASVCHGIEIVVAADVIRGRRITTVAKCRYDAESAGATYVDEPIVVDGNLVTARTFWDSAPWMREFMWLLNETRGRG